MATSLASRRDGAAWILTAAVLTFIAPAASQVEEGYNITDQVICLPNPPADRVCHLTPETTKWLYKVVGEKLKVNEMPAKSRQAFIKKWRESPCIGKGGDFNPLRRTAVMTPGTEYYLCIFRTRIYEDGRPFMVFYPRDDQDKIQESDVMPWLMRMATSGNGMAIDVGAGDSGVCSWPLLAEGHTVHMFENGYTDANERAFVQLTRDINGWQDRATLHGPVRPDRYVEKLFQNTSRIHLLKIDVDDMDSYKNVFGGVGPILNRTDIVQLEMLAEEIGMQGTSFVMRHFKSRGFAMYGLEDIETFPGRQHFALGSSCSDGDIEMQLHPDAVEYGLTDYQYGQYGPWKMQMFPICQCSSSSPKLTHNSRATSQPLRCNFQFAFVRLTSAAFTNVANKYGSCESLCAEKSKMEL